MDVRHKNSYAGIDEYAVRLLRKRAKQLVGKAGFTKDDREDLEQELLFDLICRLPKFNPERAGRKTFITRLVNNKIFVISESKTSAKRDYRLCVASLNDYVEEKDDGSMELGEIIGQDKYFLITGKCSRPPVELGDLSVEIKRIIAGLPPPFRRLCEQLQVETITEISQNTGISRASIYEDIKELRQLFENIGLKNYF
ncbi:MAG: RNA polymerase subunit sigma-24 [Candidatus Schekmanbacteria bacterium]|nr:RNA polymerase subunit sigma-24 [Candidatus Schekmanbacteria bacterium]